MRTAPLGLVCLAAAATAGCAAGFGRVDGLLVEAQPEPRPLRAEEAGRVQVTQGTTIRPARRGMALRPGDQITTDVAGIAILTLAGGYQVILDPGTTVTIENPSVFMRAGRAIIRKVKEIREGLTVRTQFAAAGVEGTEFVVETTQGGPTRISVLEGRVRVTPGPGSTWRDTVYYTAGNRASASGPRVDPLPPLDSPTTTSLRRRITSVERAMRPAFGSAPRLAVTPTLGLYAPTEPLFVFTNTELNEQIEFKAEAAPAVGARLGFQISPRFGLDLTGGYAPSEVRLTGFDGQGLPADTKRSANYFFGSGRASVTVTPPDRRYWVSLNGGVSLIQRSGDLYDGPGEVDFDLTNIGGVGGVVAGAMVGNLIGIYLAADTYFYTISVREEGNSQRDIHVALGVRIPLGR